MKVRIGARSSPLSRAQCREVQEEIFAQYFGLEVGFVFIETLGDRDRGTSLRGLEKSDFFTRELDQMLLKGEIQVAIHSAKDLPDPLPCGLSLAYLTRGVDPRDSLVLKPGKELSSCTRIATSSLRREEAVRQLLSSGITFVDLRGNIEERLELLEKGEVDGVVVAESALIRLQLTHLPRIYLPGKTAPLQGKLALVIRTEDVQLRALLSLVNSI